MNRRKFIGVTASLVAGAAASRPVFHNQGRPNTNTAPVASTATVSDCKRIPILLNPNTQNIQDQDRTHRFLIGNSDDQYYVECEASVRGVHANHIARFGGSTVTWPNNGN